MSIYSCWRPTNRCTRLPSGADLREKVIVEEKEKGARVGRFNMFHFHATLSSSMPCWLGAPFDLPCSMILRDLCFRSSGNEDAFLIHCGTSGSMVSSYACYTIRLCFLQNLACS